MGITCCNDTQELFLEIEECKTIGEIEIVMRNKAKNILIEIKEISDFINDPTQKPKVIKVEDIQKEYLIKRIEYIQEIQQCYNEAAGLLSKKNYLNVIAVKEYMKEIIDLYTYIYDDSKKYVVSMLKFKDYVSEEEKYHDILVNDTKRSLAQGQTPTPTPTPPALDESGQTMTGNSNSSSKQFAEERAIKNNSKQLSNSKHGNEGTNGIDGK